MAAYEYSIADFDSVAAGAAVLGSGGGGSYQDATRVLAQLRGSWSGMVVVKDYDAQTDCCIVAMMGSPDAGDALTLQDVYRSIYNTVEALAPATGSVPGCVIPVEVGPINSIVPLIAATMNGPIAWVVNGDGAGRAVPELPQTTYGASANLQVSPSALGNDADGVTASVQSAVLNAANSSQVEDLAGGVLKAFGSFGGLAAWPSNASNGYALQGNYISGTLEQARQLGSYLLAGQRSTDDVVTAIQGITARSAASIFENFYITQVSQQTSSASLDAGVIRFDNNPDPNASTQTYYLYNLNESLILYSAQSIQPCIVAPDSICYFSEDTGRGFTNATDDLAVYYDAATGKTTGNRVSIIKVTTAPQLYNAPGVLASFAGLLRNIGYAGALPPG